MFAWLVLARLFGVARRGVLGRAPVTLRHAVLTTAAGAHGPATDRHGDIAFTSWGIVGNRVATWDFEGPLAVGHAA